MSGTSQQTREPQAGAPPRQRFADRFIDSDRVDRRGVRRRGRRRRLHLDHAAVFLRHLDPDCYDFGRLLLGILIFWGIGATSYRGTHITVDLLWANVGPRWQRAIDVFATLVLLFVVIVHTWTLYDKVVATRADNILTFDLRLPAWPFFAIAWLGDAAAVILISVRTYRLLFHPERLDSRHSCRRSNERAA